jgi:DNA polymerase I-like protein with 3'-5' exonuclease and polymerase domains
MNRYLEIVRDVVPPPEPMDAPPSPASNNGVTAPPADTDLTPARAAGAFTVNISEEEFRFSIWSDEQLANGVIAIDTETTLIRENEVPDLALISVSDGDCHYLIHPDKLAAFLVQHQHHHFVCHNAAFDFWVVEQYLRERSASEALAAWWNVADVGHLHDTMLLDMLVDLGKTDSFPRPRNLAVVSNHYTGLSIDKSDPFRLRYGEIIGKDWGSVDPGFFSYAIKDAIVTHRAHVRLEQEAKELVKPHLADILPDAVDRFGVLTETLQVRAAIALAVISRHGMHLDQETVSTVQHRIRDELDVQIDYLKGMPCATGLFKTAKDGQIRVTPKAETPSLSTKRLVEVLVRIAEETDQDITIKRTPKGSVSTAAKTWAQYSDVHPFILHWVKMAELAKLCQFFRNLQHSVIHPRYTPLVRTGRVSCMNPNIQQLPRSGGFREMVLASPGHYLLAVDYSYVELCTLAAACEFRYRSSTLADVIRGGTDPHVHTAAMFANMSLEEFQRLEVDDPQRYATLRQRAKALNFGIPGGLGAASLVAYARSAYGVKMSFDDAQEFRQRLIQDVYPELTAYLYEETYTILAFNLK